MIARMRKHKVIISFMGNDLNGNVNRKNILSLASRLQLSINHSVARFCTFAIVKSNRLSAHLDKIVNKAVIPNGVDLDRFYPADRAAVRRELGWSDDSRYFLFLADPGRPEKNFPMVENAFRSIRDEKIRLVVRFDIAHAELYRYLSAADGLILASFQEGSPNVVKEAMACNCPVIATDVGDVAEVIGDTQGCHITGFDPEELAGKIQTVAGDGTRTRGRERILELGLDSGSIADRILGIYKQVLNKK